MIKAVIFDLNGVFLESAHFSERFEEKFGTPSEEVYLAVKEILAEVRKPGLADSFKFWQPYLRKWNLSLTKDELFSFWFSGEKLVPELLDYAKQLRDEGVKVFILSNNFRERTEYYRQQFPELFEGLDGAYFSWETGFVKPDPEAYLNILRSNNLKPEEVLYFDDSSKNIETAKEIGIDSQEYEGIKKTREVVESKLLSYNFVREQNK